ncbi:hypothetical protein VNO78_00872 [Psophocarpus tetragonolobus]|uniref:Uncharacterized protein n=1 Tax=Psophocarpus tetragonolobus TaxID=3891 RepID=A0AAN9SYH8_PSOTE
MHMARKELCVLVDLLMPFFAGSSLADGCSSLAAPLIGACFLLSDPLIDKLFYILQAMTMVASLILSAMTMATSWGQPTSLMDEDGLGVCPPSSGTELLTKRVGNSEEALGYRKTNLFGTGSERQIDLERGQALEKNKNWVDLFYGEASEA